MSNIVVPPTFNGQVAAAFQGQAAGDDLSGGITGGYGLMKYRGKVWSIQHNGNTMNLMRDDGDGPRGSIDVVILKANAQLSKTFYINGWDENNNNPPDCASANGIVPDQGVPHKQNDVCATCPRNAWGSAPNGGKGKACGDHRRMAIVPLTDLRNEHFGGPLLLRCPAASLQDLAAFDSRYKALGYPYYTMGIKIGFDAAESFPKFTFQAIRPLDENEARVVIEMRNSAETARVVNEGSAPAPAQIAAPAQQGAFLQGPPPNAVQPQQVQVQPAPQPAVAQPASVAAQQPAPVQPVAQPVANGGGGAPAPATGFGPAAVVPAAAQPAPAQPAAQQAGGGGFGATQPATQAAQQPTTNPVTAAPAPAPAAGAPQVAPNVNPPQASRPAMQMTGFGGGATVTPEVTQPATNPAPAVAQPATQVVEQAAQPVTPGVVTAFEGSIDERLNALLG